MPWLKNRTGPTVRSRHEFATASVARHVEAHILAPERITPYATNAAMTSATACMPTVTQLAPMASASRMAGHRSRGQRATPTSAARHTQTTWNAGSAVIAVSPMRSRRRSHAHADSAGTGLAGATSGTSR